MHSFEIIFSNDRNKRITRHVIFWMTWWIYFAGSFFINQQGLNNGVNVNWLLVVLIKTFLLLFGHAFIVYTLIYFLLPLLIIKARYTIFVFGLLSAGGIIMAWSYFCYAMLFSPIDRLLHVSTAIMPKSLLWGSITAGMISALKVMAAATAIKLLKHWYLKQKQIERLEKEKILVELQLLKAQIHPDVLFSSLDDIYSFAQSSPSRASELLLKLSDLLSYILYECDDVQVSLEKEVKLLKDYIALEQTRMGDQLETSIVVKGNIKNKSIAPLLLLPFIENCFLYCNPQLPEKAWLNLDIKVEEDELAMKLVNGKSASKEMPASIRVNGLSNVYKRLNVLYPGRNEVRFHAEPEMMMTFIKIKLDSDYQTEEYTQPNKMPESKTMFYAS